MMAIECKGIVKKYGKVVAVDGASFCVERGELFALLGVNGAGKTTLIKILSCLISQTEGSATVLGYDTRTEKEKIKAKISVSPQESAVAGNLTVYENLVFIAEIYGFNRLHAKQKADEMVEKFALQDVKDRQAKKLSGGYARRLSIAMALISEPSLIFLDEPTLGLDVISRRALWQVVKELKGKATVVLTTHYLEEAVALSDRLAIMSSGKIKAVGTADELMLLSGKDNFEDAFIAISNPCFCEKKGVNLNLGGDGR